MIEFFFDCSSPWTYLAFHNIQPLAAEAKLPIRWRPVLVGGVFNSVNPSVYASREHPVPAKLDYQRKDLMTEAAGQGIHYVTEMKPARQILSDLVDEALDVFDRFASA